MGIPDGLAHALHVEIGRIEPALRLQLAEQRQRLPNAVHERRQGHRAGGSRLQGLIVEIVRDADLPFPERDQLRGSRLDFTQRFDEKSADRQRGRA